MVDRTVDGDVQQDVHKGGDVDAAAPDLTVSRQLAAWARSEPQEPLPPEAASHQQVVVGDIPVEPPGFRPRADLLADLDRAGERVSVIHAGTGLHGLGTTQLAAAYARAKQEAGWRLVAWVNGANIGSLLAGLAAVADATGLTGDDSGRGVTDAAAAVRHWLETDGDRCLLVFDDVSDPEVLHAFVPAHGTARVLIISTRQSAANLGRTIPFDVFGVAEASAFLATRTGLDDAAGTAAAQKNQPSDGTAGQMLRVGFPRPPADPSKRVLPARFRRPPIDPARRPLPDSIARPPASTSRAQNPPEAVPHDCEVVAAITAEDPVGIAMAYDRYAATLYGYCHWMLHDSADAAAALKNTFVMAAARLSDLSEPSKLRPRLFALARNECRRRIRPRSAAHDVETDAVGQPSDATGEMSDETTVPFPVLSMPFDATMPFRVVSHPTYGLAHFNGDRGQAELQSLIHSILAGLKPREREVIELSFRHDLSDNDLAIVLGVSWRQAHALASHARGRLEQSVSALHVALARREACPVLGELLADWDGQLTEQTRGLVVWHMEECQTCAHHEWSALRPATFSRLLPLAPLPPELREQILSLCASTAEDAVAYRRRIARHPEWIWFARFPQAIRYVSWNSIRANPGVAIAAAAVAVWVVAAVSVTLLTFVGSRAAHAQAAQPTGSRAAHAQAAQTSIGTFSRSPAVAPATATAPTSAAARPSPSVTQPSAYVPSPVQSSPLPRASPSSSRSTSSSPRPSKSPSPSRSALPSPSHTASPSPSSSPSPTA
jgi:RNA polymerase sigma factor (sigma-70 family)